jgi:glycosyltransferase involved in cell wall biosynthesis
MTEGEPVVAIHAQLLPGSAGGIETNLLSLLGALSDLEEGDQIAIGPGGAADWLVPHLGPRQSILPWPPIRLVPRGRAGPLRARLRALSGVLASRRPWETARLWGGLSRRFSWENVLEGARVSRALVDRGVKVVHFPYQRHFPTWLPTVFEPWDLQHRHFPEFFSPEEIELREAIYRTGCETARLVVTASEWTKRDLIDQLGVDPGKIAVIRRGHAARPPAPPAPAEAFARLRPLALPERFILYPAKTWPHKNHLRLLEALAQLRDTRGLTIPLVCTGKPVAEQWPRIQETLERRSLAKAVFFPGHQDADTMAALFTAADFLVFPSLFEGLGIPLLEAMHFGLPVVSSTATCLPEVAGSAAVYFDPTSVDEMAEAIGRVWSDRSLRDECRARGTARVARFRWSDAARRFSVCYRHAAGRRLEPSDAMLLAEMTGRGSPPGAAPAPGCPPGGPACGILDRGRGGLK